MKDKTPQETLLIKSDIIFSKGMSLDEVYSLILMKTMSEYKQAMLEGLPTSSSKGSTSKVLLKRDFILKSDTTWGVNFSSLINSTKRGN